METHYCVLIVETLPHAIVGDAYLCQQRARHLHVCIVEKHFRSGSVLSVIEINNIWQVEESNAQQRKYLVLSQVFL